ncbi:EamA family transporter RarD [Pseudonocardia broussonetiae]|uniref:EamA family transporter RarD n=1 Tax=Pseudonocardia broussonetiae TaxID=2736640 RepID=A0A6M6JGP4_9PSEU|nr:EamA family transporter RarD [Pseudonocardia broussonetiae]
MEGVSVLRAERPALSGRGVGAAVAAYSMWGLFPAFWPLLAPAAPVEVLAHRIGWTAVLMAGVLAVLRGWGELATLRLRSWLAVFAGGVFIAVNWGVYIGSVFAGLVIEAALGYFMSPLVSVLLAVVVLRERLRPAQWAAVATAVVAVVVIAVEGGRPPWVALVLATSFGLYGLIKSTVPLTAAAGLTAESLALGPVALGVIAWFELTGTGTMAGFGPGHLLLLVAAGPVTALPLLLYAVGARRVPMSTIGVLMYINPTLQFLWGVLVVREEVPPLRWVGFVLVWAALVVFTVDLVRTARSDRAARLAPPA